jgi:hypothetical protein
MVAERIGLIVPLAIFAALTALGRLPAQAQEDLRMELRLLRQQLAQQQRLIESQLARPSPPPDPLVELRRSVKRLEELPAQDSEPSAARLSFDGGPAVGPLFDTAAAPGEQSPGLEQPLSRPQSSEAPKKDGLQFGYSQGFFIASPEGREGDPGAMPFLLRVNSWLQGNCSITPGIVSKRA